MMKVKWEVGYKSIKTHTVVCTVEHGLDHFKLVIKSIVALGVVKQFLSNWEEVV